MKKLLLLLATTTCAFSAIQANAGDATAVGNAKATIVNNIKISAVNGEDLDFGVIASTAQENQVTVKAASGNRLATINGSLITDAGRSGTRGKFTIAGTPNIPVTINEIQDATLTGPNSASMVVSGMKTNAVDDTVTLDENGQGEFLVGGILKVGANQEVGEYEGTYTITASY